MELAAMTKRRHNYWTSEKEAKLIQLYKNYSLLWDSRHPEYYKRDKRDKAMRAIAKAMDNEFDVINVKDKIKTLRDYFVKEMKKEDASRHSMVPGYVSRWEHFGSWNFLRVAITNEPSPSSVNSDFSIKREPQDVYPVFPGSETVETMILPSTPDSSSDADEPQPAAANTQVAHRFILLKPLPRQQESPASLATCATSLASSLPPLLKKPRKSETREPPVGQQNNGCSQGIVLNSSETCDVSNRTATASPPCDTTNSAKSPASSKSTHADFDGEDDEVLFCRHVISELRQMPKYQKDLTKLRIQQALFEVKYMSGPCACQNAPASEASSPIPLGLPSVSATRSASIGETGRSASPPKVPPNPCELDL